MAENSNISWTNNTWNPWQGCVKVSAGCKNCYMYRDKKRYGQDPSAVVRSKDKTFYKPLHWKTPVMVFTCSWSDFFIEQADEWRDDAWGVIRDTPHLTYQILTKRPERISLPDDWGSGWDNVWMGVSVENQDNAHRIATLADVPAKVRFVSYEPTLGELDISEYSGTIDWLIAGGESGVNPRPIERDWATGIRDQCVRYDIPFFFKQWGNRKDTALLDGREWHEFPI